MDVRVMINLFHIMIVAPFLIWVGVSRGNAPEGIYMVLLALGILVTLYHGYKSWVRLASHSAYVWVNLIHALKCKTENSCMKMDLTFRPSGVSLSPQ